METISCHDRELTHILGKGTYGKVYKIEQKEQSYAYKINLIYGGSVDGLASLREMSFLRYLSSPNIVSIAGVDIRQEEVPSIEDGAYECDSLRLVFPLAKENLYKYYSRAGSKDLKRVIRDTAMGIKHLHELGIIHADLKPENILIFEDERAVLADLGLTHFYDRWEPIGVPCYAPCYRAPELFGGGVPYFSSDIWALGCIVYEVYMGEMLVPSSTADDLENPPPSTTDGSWLEKFDTKMRNHPQYQEVREILTMMLELDEEKRASIDEVMAHTFFSPAPPTTEMKYVGEHSIRERSPSDVVSIQALLRHLKKPHPYTAFITPKVVFHALELFDEVRTYLKKIKSESLSRKKKPGSTENGIVNYLHSLTPDVLFMIPLYVSMKCYNYDCEAPFTLLSEAVYGRADLTYSISRYKELECYLVVKVWKGNLMKPGLYEYMSESSHFETADERWDFLDYILPLSAMDTYSYENLVNSYCCLSQE